MQRNVPHAASWYDPALSLEINVLALAPTLAPTLTSPSLLIGGTVLTGKTVPLSLGPILFAPLFEDVAQVVPCGTAACNASGGALFDE